MINEKVEKALNEQINAELYSSYLYLSMSADFEDKNFEGFASWMKAQAAEELIHAMKIFDYVNERGGKVTLEMIKAPKASWDSPLNAFTKAYEHERKVTKMINDLVDLSRSENDHATENFLIWFVDEQVEEEATADSIVSKLKMVEGAKGAIYMLDKELGSRKPLFSLQTGEEGE